MRQLYLGIDLGTTNSKAAFLDYREGDTPRPTALEFNQFIEKDEQAFWNYLPSVVYFQNDGKTAIVGEYARRATVNFPGNTVRAVKRLMGKNWRFQPMGWSNDWTPHGISGLILKKIRDRSLENLGDNRNDLAHVAISVPASFSISQRHAT